MSKELMDAVNENPMDFLENYLAQTPRDFFSGFKMPAMPDGRADVTEDGQAYHVTIELPGYQKANIKLDYRHGNLSVRANHDVKKQAKDKKGTVIRREISNAGVDRNFRLPNVNFAKITASYDGGLLKVTLPKQNPRQNDEHQITIK